MRLCDLCLGQPSSTVDVALERRGPSSTVESVNVTSGDLCDRCLETISSKGLAQGIEERFAERPRKRRSPTPADGDSDHPKPQPRPAPAQK